MQRQISSMLLGGVMMLTAPLPAQGVSSAPQPKYPFDVAVTYGATKSDAIAGSSFWMQGGSIEVHGQFYRGLGVVADVAGMHAGNIGASSVGLDLVTATFGPRYTWSPAHRHYALFGQVLVGEAFGLNSVFPAAGSSVGNANSLAVKAGGGMNIGFSPHLALRAFEINWLHTQLPNATTNAQNNVSLAAGIVFRFR